MTAQLTTLINTPDAFELVRDKIAEILLVEEEHQRELAILENEDPERFRLRVFVERSNPWEEWTELDRPGSTPADVVAPIVNVVFDNENFDARTSNVVARQRATGTFNIDVFGYGASTLSDDGHDPGDSRAALEAQRGVRLVRNIIMAGAYTYLGFPRRSEQFVWKRFIQSVQMFQPSFDGRPVQHVCAGRIQLQVDFSEFSPQVEGQELQTVQVAVRRAENGEVFLNAQYGT